MPTHDIDLLISVFFKTNRFLHRYIYKHKSISDFSFLQFLTLKFINEEECPSMKEIAKFLSIKPASATSLINDLAREGFLERIADLKDRRIIRLKITKSGREKIEENLRHSKRGLKEVFSKLEERDRENLIKIFNKLSSILSSNLN